MVGIKIVKSAAEIVWMNGTFSIIGLRYCEMFHVITVNSTTLYSVCCKKDNYRE